MGQRLKRDFFSLGFGCIRPRVLNFVFGECWYNIYTLSRKLCFSTFRQNSSEVLR